MRKRTPMRCPTRVSSSGNKASNHIVHQRCLVMARQELIGRDLQQYRDALKKMRSRVPNRKVNIQEAFPDIPYKGGWVKITVPLIKAINQYEGEMPEMPYEGEFSKVKSSVMSGAAQKALAPYMIVKEGVETVYVMQMVGNEPAWIFRLELWGEGRADHRNRQILMEGRDNEGEITPILGYGGESKPLRSWRPTNNPTIGIYLYSFNIRNYFIFKPDKESDYYGVVNQSFHSNDEVI